MSLMNDAFNSISDLKLWYDVQSGQPLLLTDIPEIIQQRWTYIRDNWATIKDTLKAKVNAYADPALLSTSIDDFSNFIDLQRYSKINPLSRTDIYKKYYAIFDNLEISSIAPSNEEQKIISKNVERVNGFTRTDFAKIRTDIQRARDEYVDTIGCTDGDYNAAVKRSPVSALKSATIVDMQQVLVLQSAIKSTEYILANIFSLPTVFVDPFALAKANTNNPEFDVTSYSSGLLVRMQYGDDLKTLAARYLNNADSWLEIAISNGLKPPYIDEVGEKIKLVSNGSGNQVNLPALDGSGKANIDKLFINQNILLQSDTIPFSESRTIVNIKTIPVSGEIVLELSGDFDLDRFKAAENANVRVFKPNTTNSNFFILIPVTQPTEPQLQSDVPWFLKTKKEDEKQAKVDLLLSDSNDLVFSAAGDVSLSYGVANAVQAVKLKLSSERGTLSRHSDFGIANVVGFSTAHAEQAASVLTESIVQAIEADTRFSRVEQINAVPITDGAASGFLVQLVVRLAGTGTPIPITFTINPS